MRQGLQEYIQRKLRQGDLGSLPHVLHDLLRVMDNPRSSARDLERIIAADPSLSARVLRLANSAMYGLHRRISDLRHAVALVGSSALRRTIMSTTAFDACFRRGTVTYNRGELWRHSLQTAACARSIALRRGDLPAEAMFIGGLLHELGIVVLDQYAHGVFIEMLAAVATPGTQKIAALERALIGTTHAEIGFWVAEAWHLPEMLAAAIRHHHEPFQAGEHVLAAAIVAAADILCMSEDDYDKEWVQSDAQDLFAWLGLDVSQQAAILADSQEELRAIEAFMSPGKQDENRRVAS